MTHTGVPSTESRESWVTKLGEAALLPTSDARRQAVEAQVARRGGWIREEWLALIAEEEGLRLALHRATPPGDLAERLLALPDRHWPLRLLPRPLRRMSVAVAAVALITLGVGAAILLRTQPDPHADHLEDQAIHDVALLSISDHLDTHEVEHEAVSAQALSRTLSEAVPFSVRIPDLSAAFDLVGGRRCTLGSHPVAFSSWRSKKGGAVTVLQLRSQDFDLPRTLSLRGVSPTGAAAAKHEGGAVLLAHDGFVWVCVADDPADLARARAELERLGVESE